MVGHRFSCADNQSCPVPRNKGMKPLPNDDPEVDPAEIEAASDETPTSVGAPELNAVTKDLTAWDEPPADRGTAATKVLPEDEISAAEQFVAEGMDEADRDQRIAAADPDFEP
jgi:hypothetical protein